MILAGIDEAGYGPLLGPLVVGCCAFELDGPADPLPDLWARLRRVVGKSRDRTGRKIHVNDSKRVYSPSIGLRELERAVLAISTAAAEWPADLNAFIGHVAAHALPDLTGYPWYVPAAGERFPLEQEAMSIRLVANGLAAEMQRTRTRCCYLAAQLLPERQYNQLVERTHNKSSVLFTASAMHLDHLLRTWGTRGLTIFCDRQGGREHYGHLLRLMFEDWSLAVIAEKEGDCEYRLSRGGHDVRLIFREKAEKQCLSVAVASMLCKYLRESLMRRFNAWWAGQVPGVAPTAGYYVDGQRFMKDIDARRQQLGIADDQIIRSR